MTAYNQNKGLSQRVVMVIYHFKSCILKFLALKMSLLQLNAQIVFNV